MIDTCSIFHSSYFSSFFIICHPFSLFSFSLLDDGHSSLPHLHKQNKRVNQTHLSNAREKKNKQKELGQKVAK